ncbi:hypothetical protein F5X68DRAFT_204144 [Plectosphaerella plurivora]|uniref:Uncharacterized protein n=1 Tax=Plectosphaerella plurivora TaxID=936078 RepID=A0A9P8VF16_9PEZI|nr:hypothetical protein F5X68DRAFT_204144 [Plectosphaerella plurivora]
MLNSSQEFFRLWLAPMSSDKITRFEQRVNNLRKGDLASLVPWEESVARLESGINPSLLLQFFEGSDPFDPSDFAKPVLELMETERNSVNELLRPLRNLAFATSIYENLEGASISSRIVTTGLADPAWGDAQTSSTPTRSQVFGCIAMMESGVIDLKLEHIEQVFGLSSGNSLFVLSRLVSDPGLQHKVSKTAVTRLVGNVGHPGVTLLTTALPESPCSLLDNPDKWNDSFSSASLRLSLTQEEPAFSYTVHSDLRPKISLLKCFFSLQDKARWITHVDILAALDNGLIPTMPRPSAKCDGSSEKNRPELAKEILERTKEVDSWEQWDNELQEGERQVVFWKTGGNSAARLALAAYMVSLGTGKKKAAIKDYAVLENEGTDCRVCIYRRVKQYVKKHGRQGSKETAFWVIE